MRTFLTFVSLMAVAILAGRTRRQPPTNMLPGDMGYMLGTQVACDDFFCQMSHLSLLHYTFPPPSEHKGTIMSNFTASYAGGTTMFIGRFTAYDFNTNRYFVLTQMDGVGDQEYILYTIKVLSNPPTVSLVPVTQASKFIVTSIQYDVVDNILYAVFDTSMFTLDPSTGDIKLVGPITTQSEIAPGLTTYYDSNLHIYWIAVDDDIHGTHLLLSYNTRTKTSTMTPALNNGDYWTLYGMAYHPKLDLMVAITQNPRGWPSIKTVNYTNGEHVDLVPEWIWGDYDVDYDLWPQDTYTNQIEWLDLELNIFWFTVKWTDPETLAENDALVYYNLTKGGIEMGSGPMVIYVNALEFTNYVWFHWPNTTYH